MSNYIDLNRLNFLHRKDFTDLQYSQICNAIDDDIAVDDIIKFAIPDYSSEKMFIIRSALKESNQIFDYINPNMSVKLIRQISGIISQNNNPILGYKLTKEELNNKINLLIMEF